MSVQSISDDRAMANVLRGSSFLLALGLFFIAGIGLAFTPCVFPMVPILSTIIVGEGEWSDQVASVYLGHWPGVSGMALTYALVGLLVGLFGAELNLQATLQSPIVLSVFAAVFVLLSGAMFGFYELALPQGMQQWINERSAAQKGWPPSVRVRHGIIVKSGGVTLHFRTARGCIDLSLKYWRCGARRVCPFCSGLGHGCAIDGGRRQRWSLVAASRCLDGYGKGYIRFWVVGCGNLAARTARARLRGFDSLGGLVDRGRGVSGCF